MCEIWNKWSQPLPGAKPLPGIYVHLSGRDVDLTLLKHYGIKVETQTEDLLELKTCPWCRTLNSASARFCQSCNTSLVPRAPAKRRRSREKGRASRPIVSELIPEDRLVMFVIGSVFVLVAVVMRRENKS